MGLYGVSMGWCEALRGDMGFYGLIWGFYAALLSLYGSLCSFYGSLWVLMGLYRVTTYH